MIDLLSAIHHPPNPKIPIHLSKGFRSNIAWWNDYSRVEWGLIPPSPRLSPMGGALLQRIRVLGLSCVLQQLMVPASVGHLLLTPLNCGGQ